MKMRPNNNIAVVQRLYQARGDATVIRELVDRDVRWEVVEGFPYSDVYLGLDDLLGRFFARLFADFEDWHTEPEEFFEVDNRVIAVGRYSGRAKATDRTFQARFAHVWTLRDGVIVRLQHCADTVQIAKGWVKISARSEYECGQVQLSSPLAAIAASVLKCAANWPDVTHRLF